MRSPNVDVRVDLDHVRAAAEAVRDQTRVAVMPVIKADAYGLGAQAVADALGPIAAEFCYFAVHEARAVQKPGLCLGPPLGDPEEFRALKLRPGVGTVADAERFRGMRVCIKVDTGMQRFGASVDQIDALVERCDVQDYMSHVVTLEALRKFTTACAHRGRPLHAACTSLLHCPEAWLSGVRPGIRLYQGAVRVTTRLVAVHDLHGPAGYTGFTCPRVGIILAGYSNLVRPAPVIINGRSQQMLEVGMNTTFVSAAPDDKVGDEVVLLGDALTEATLAEHLGIRPHEVLCRYTAMGERRYA